MIPSLPVQHRVQIDKFTSDGVTDVFKLTHQPVQTQSVMVDGVYKKMGIVGMHFFFQGYEALINESASTVIFAAPPPNTRMLNNIEVVYIYDPARPTPIQSSVPSTALPGQVTYAMYPTGRMTPTPKTAPAQKAIGREVAGWQESDYLDYTDFETAMKANEPVSYALCQWLMRQSRGHVGDPFTDSQWEEWHTYALDHCPRFAQEQPKRR
jgi:hypothetical protein